MEQYKTSRTFAVHTQHGTYATRIYEQYTYNGGRQEKLRQPRYRRNPYCLACHASTTFMQPIGWCPSPAAASYPVAYPYYAVYPYSAAYPYAAAYPYSMYDYPAPPPSPNYDNYN